MKSRRIDKLGLCQNFGTHPLLQTGFRHQIHSAPDQAFQFFAQRSKLDQANPSVRFRVDQDVYITFGPQIPACGRPEDSEFSNVNANTVCISPRYDRSAVRYLNSMSYGAPTRIMPERTGKGQRGTAGLLAQPVQVLHQGGAFLGIQFAIAVLIECLEHSFEELQFSLWNAGRQVVDAVAFG